MNGLKYEGKGFLPGVPARDLSPEEVEQYGGEKVLLASGLYRKVKPATSKALKPTENKMEVGK